MTAVLEARALERRFGAFRATDNVSLSLKPGARHALIGPNGAGKTTLINLLSGTLQPHAGSVLLNGVDVTSRSAEWRVRQGLARTFQINRLFADLTVLETIALAVGERLGHGWQFWRSVGRNKDVMEEAASLLTILRLADIAGRRTRDLAYGKQRLVEIAVALALKPRVLLLDEPAAGVPRGESRELFETLANLPRDVTILLIEHDMDLVFRFADRVTVLVSGAVLAEDTPEAIARDPKVREAYLGDSAHG